MKLVLIALLSLVPLGCQRAAAERPASVVAAKVNGVEISLPRATAGNAGLAQALDRIIDRELLAQAALQEGLERDPLVL